ncbi:PfkB family carbohydrate kinase [Candidatus Marinimicrobia bacterium]|nr:PfkB family carbohydrate kinase [Candidatus Neomarinimicrobiota bacterium]
MKKEKLVNLLKTLKSFKPKVLVIGDLMLDSYIYGDVNRISPEAPVPILNFEHQRETLGGSGNVVSNLINFGANVEIASIIGNEMAGDIVISKLKDISVSSNFIIRSKSVNTTKKTRYVSGISQLLRLDNDSDGIALNELNRLEKKIKSSSKNFDCIIISDYNKGLCQKSFLENIISFFKKKSVPIFVDPKGKSWIKYKGINCITPNILELETEMNITLKSDSDFEKSGYDIVKKLKLESCLITRGADGMTYVSSHEVIHQKINPVEVFDVSGAGDTVITSFALSRLQGYTTKECLAIASFASSEVVKYTGTTPFNFNMVYYVQDEK